MRTSILLALGLVVALLAATPARATDIDLNNIANNQTSFRLLSEDLGSVLSYRAQTPAEPLGVLGFDIGVGVTASKLQNVQVFNQVIAPSTVSSTVYVPTVSARLGLPFGFDIGAMGASVPDSNVKFFGGELRYAIVKGGTVMPAIGLSANMTKLTGVDQLSLDTRGIELSISKGFAIFTPYAGIGKVWISSTPNGVPGLHNEDFSLNKGFIGLGTKILLFNINLEGDRTGEVNSYSLKVGLRF